MFSGIIKEVGIIKSIKSHSGKKALVLKADKTKPDINIGDSLAINGACHTVIDNNNYLSVESIKSTLELTNLGSLKINDKVNLEPALKFNDNISGHIVSGHVEGTARISKIIHKKNYRIITLSIPSHLAKYIVPKGSIALDGISLTISSCVKNLIQVAIIPHTMENTTLTAKIIGSKINIETDIMAKYAAKLNRPDNSKSITKSTLINNGFI